MTWERVSRRDVVGSADYNGDGRVTEAEKSEAATAFDAVDQNHDEAIDQAEYDAVVAGHKAKVKIGPEPFEAGPRLDAPAANGFRKAILAGAALQAKQPQAWNNDTLERLQQGMDPKLWDKADFDFVAAQIQKMRHGEHNSFLGTQQESPLVQNELAKRGINPLFVVGEGTGRKPAPEAIRTYLLSDAAKPTQKELQALLAESDDLRIDEGLIRKFANDPFLVSQFDRKAVRRNPEAWESYQAYQIAAPQFTERFSSDLLEKLTANRLALRTEDPDKPRTQKTAVVFFPTEDWNGAFKSAPTVSDLMDAGYFLLHYEMRSDRDVVRFLKDATHDGKSPLDVLVLGAHGLPWGMQVSPGLFGAGLTDASMLGTEDLVKLRLQRVSRYVKPNADIILVSCSTGAGGHLKVPLNVVSAIWEAFGRKANVWGPAVSTQVAAMKFDAEGRIVNPGYLLLDESQIVHIQAEIEE